MKIENLGKGFDKICITIETEDEAIFFNTVMVRIGGCHHNSPRKYADKILDFLSSKNIFDEHDIRSNESNNNIYFEKYD